VVTIYGLCAVTFMMVMYALEQRGRPYVLGFVAGYLLSSVYGFLAGAWPFGVVEIVWSVIAAALSCGFVVHFGKNDSDGRSSRTAHYSGFSLTIVFI